MWNCILGERKTGKSVYIENRVKEIDTEALYIATLPNIKRYQSVIEQHKNRRPSTWKCMDLFRLSAEEIRDYPYLEYKNIILDNLSYFLLYQIYFRKERFLEQCNDNFFALIEMLAQTKTTTVYLIDTPVRMGLLEEDERIWITYIFDSILEGAVKLEKFHDDGTTSILTVQESKTYFYNYEEEAPCQKHLRQNN